MSWELIKMMGQTVMTITVYVFLFGAGVAGLMFTGVFCLWLYDKAKKDLYD